MLTEMRVATDSDPLVSVIIVTYNDGIWLSRCLESLRKQSISENLEVIVADNASTDDTAAIARTLLTDSTLR